MTEAVSQPDQPQTVEGGDMTGDRDLFSKFDPLIKMRSDLLSTGVTDPFGLVM